MIKILHGSQIRDWDDFTINHEPISSIDLMERASTKITDAILNLIDFQHFTIFCGSGNNGGDGLAIARLLKENGKNINVYQIIESQYSHDCTINRKRLLEIQNITDIDEHSEILFQDGTCIIDALLGTGLSRPLDGLIEKIINHINTQKHPVLSIDIPTGMFTDQSSKGNSIIKATHVFTFQSYKPCFFLPENAQFLGTIHVIDIGLDKEFLKNVHTNMHLLEKEDVKFLVKKRNPFSHKGHFGKAVIIGGSKGMLGALILSLKACLRSGVGKVYGSVATDQFSVIHQSIPESLVISRSHIKQHIEQLDLEKFGAIGIGPGLGTDSSDKELLLAVLNSKIPLVLDADALNIIAENKWHHLIPKGSVLTPHIGEFTRLFGEASNDMDRLKMCLNNAQLLNSVIILKGKFTAITLPDGNICFNPTGNPGMAKGGSGDVLTGMITSFLAQGLDQKDSSIIAVFLHGLAADIAVKETSEYSLLASDIIEKIGTAFLELS